MPLFKAIAGHLPTIDGYITHAASNSETQYFSGVDSISRLKNCECHDENI